LGKFIQPCVMVPAGSSASHRQGQTR
jgi:hypothetical protein